MESFTIHYLVVDSPKHLTYIQMTISARRRSYPKFVETIRKNVGSIDRMMFHGEFVHDERIFTSLHIFSGSRTVQKLLEFFNVTGGMHDTLLRRHALGLVQCQYVEIGGSVQSRTTSDLAFLINEKMKGRIVLAAGILVPIVATLFFGYGRESILFPSDRLFQRGSSALSLLLGLMASE